MSISSTFLSSMNSLSSSFIQLFTPKLPRRPDVPNLHISTYQNCRYDHCLHPLVSYSSIFSSSLRSPKPSTSAAMSSEESAISMIEFEDFVEKDWSFLESDDLISEKEHNAKINRIIHAGGILDNSSVMVSIASEGFVQQLLSSMPSQKLLIIHDSLLALACIKEKYDKVNCWQGELIYAPEKWGPFDVIFLYFLPALPFELNQIFDALSRRCLPGARLIISHPQGREMLEQQRQQCPDIVVSDLPDKTALREVAVKYLFELTEFIDEPGFYLAALNFCGSRN